MGQTDGSDGWVESGRGETVRSRWGSSVPYHGVRGVDQGGKRMGRMSNAWAEERLYIEKRSKQGCARFMRAPY